MEQDKIIKTKRMNIEIPLDTHCEIKKLAASRNMTMTLYVSRLFYEHAIKEKKYEQVK